MVIATIASICSAFRQEIVFAKASFSVAVGQALDLAALQLYLAGNGYTRADTVREPGEFALRGGIVDLFPPGSAEPLRLDLFGDEVEEMRRFDPMSQFSTGTVERFVLQPAGEVLFDAAAIAAFAPAIANCSAHRRRQRPALRGDYGGHRFAGMEHWLPLFHEGWRRCSTICPARR